MANPIPGVGPGRTPVTQIAKTGAGSEAVPTDAPKQGPSKFDQVRQGQQAQQPLPAVSQVPPLNTQLTAEQKRAAEVDLRKRLDSSGNDPQAIFKPDMRSARVQLDGLNRKAQTMPANPAADAVKARLDSLDAQFQESGKILEGLSTASSPGDMLKFQLQMYQFTQNMELMSKVVEQVSSGAKQILQTQL